jgi:hypothetical protein
MAVITRGSTPALMLPGLNKIWGMAYDEYKPEWKKCFKMRKSNKAYEEDASLTGMGLAPIKAEEDALLFDTMKQAYVTRYTNIAYALGYAITREEIQDNLYAEFGAQRAQNVAFSMHQTKENVAASIFNYAFTGGAHVGGDGVSLVNASHPVEGGTLSNTLSVAADLSEASLEDALIDISQFRDNRNNHINVMGQSLLIPTQLMFDATRILRNPNRPDTADRDINAIYTLGLLPGGIIENHYLNDTDAWFILTNAPVGLTYFEREAPRFESDNDFATKNALFSGYERYSFGCSDWRGFYGTEGS